MIAVARRLPESLRSRTPRLAAVVLPASFCASGNSSGNYSVSWTAPLEAAYYVLNESGGEGTLTATSKQFSGMGNGEYSYAVKACASSRLCNGYSATKWLRVCRTGTSCN